MNADDPKDAHHDCLCLGCRKTLAGLGMLEAAERVAARRKAATRRNIAHSTVINAPRAPYIPNPNNCKHCGAESGDLCPCTAEGLARLRAS